MHLWLLMAATGAAVGALWVYADPVAQANPWVALPLLLSAGLLIATALHVAQRRYAGRAQSRDRKPLAGPRPGARLPQ